MAAVIGQASGNQPTIEPPSNAEIAREKDSARKDILAAMQRILLGHPKHVLRGSESVSDLAKEAGVGRHQLYQNHPDLRNRFEYLRDRGDQPTEKETELRRALTSAETEVFRLRALQANTRKEAESWKGLTELLARAINALQEELHQEQTRAERLVRRLDRAAVADGIFSPVVMIHKRPL